MLSTCTDHDKKVTFTNIYDEVSLSTSQTIKLFAHGCVFNLAKRCSCLKKNRFWASCQNQSHRDSETDRLHSD
ncbi:type II toxin-antitoxin system RelB/DinJ family antitoxin [Vibrio breoganii]|uniref:type II toxin-antitoxin system RelB/DinJ family antitoxin n=1 Tax=Vibrio breoganii TaxID=553239 RepID=UPI003BAE4FB5